MTPDIDALPLWFGAGADRGRAQRQLGVWAGAARRDPQATRL